MVSRGNVVIRTVTHVVCGAPTVRVMVRCEDIWSPAMMILQRPGVMAEKGMPLYEQVSSEARLHPLSDGVHTMSTSPGLQRAQF